MLQNGLKAAWRTRRAPREANLDDEFYKERARHIRELADKADPFIRKRLLEPATTIQSWGDHLVQRLPWICRVPAGNNLPSDTMQSRPPAYLGDGSSGGVW